jgi:protein-disulfide isomerase
MLSGYACLAVVLVTKEEIMAIPIPRRPSGYSRGKADAPIQIEAFIDLQCPYSKKAWPTLLAVAAQYGQERIRLTIQPIVLAEHHQSWDVTKAAVAVATGRASRFLDFTEYLYAHQEEYTNAQFRDRTQKDLYALLARFAAEYAGETDTGAFFRRLDSEEVEQATKIPLRLAATRGVWSTPTFFINGAEVPQLSSSSTLADWQAVLEPLF